MLAKRDLMREVGGQLQPACPSCGKPLGHADHAAVQWTHSPADLWLPAMRCLADGSCRQPIGRRGRHCSVSSRIGAGRYS